VDLKGALVRGPHRDGFWTVVKYGYVDPAYLKYMPGCHRKNRVPSNVVPTQVTTTNTTPDPTGIKLRPYQIEAINLALSNPTGALIKLDVGLGKTLVACALAAQLKPFVVVGPLAARATWVNGDPARHHNLAISVLEGTDTEKVPQGPCDGYFINYDVVFDWQFVLEILEPKLIILDESHTIRNARTNAAKACRRMARFKTVQKRLALTATPIVNSVMDLWTQLDFVEPAQWGPWWGPYGQRYAGMIATEHTSYHQTGETNTRELKSRLNGVLIHKSRFDPEVAAELPTLEREAVRLPQEALGEHLEAYRHLARDVVGALRKIKDGPVAPEGMSLQQVTQMFSLLSKAKCAPAVERAFQLVSSYKRLVIFTWFRETAKYIAKELKRRKVVVFGPVTGGTTKRKRDEAASGFETWQPPPESLGSKSRRKDVSVNNQTTRHGPGSRRLAGTPGAVFVATVKTCGQAMNQLAVAPAMLITDLHYVPKTLIQAEGRIHRRNQKADSCHVNYLLIERTADEVMFGHLQRKAKLIQKMIQDEAATSLCETLGGPQATEKKDFEDFVARLAEIEELET
jgi:superfamily II DNA or RNA helicase